MLSLLIFCELIHFILADCDNEQVQQNALDLYGLTRQNRINISTEVLGELFQVSNSVFVNLESSQNGGAIGINSSSFLKMDNCFFMVSTSTGTAGLGGAIYFRGVDLHVSFCYGARCSANANGQFLSFVDDETSINCSVNFEKSVVIKCPPPGMSGKISCVHLNGGNQKDPPDNVHFFVSLSNFTENLNYEHSAGIFLKDSFSQSITFCNFNAISQVTMNTVSYAFIYFQDCNQGFLEDSNFINISIRQLDTTPLICGASPDAPQDYLYLKRLYFINCTALTIFRSNNNDFHFILSDYIYVYPTLITLSNSGDFTNVNFYTRLNTLQTKNIDLNLITKFNGDYLHNIFTSTCLHILLTSPFKTSSKFSFSSSISQSSKFSISSSFSQSSIILKSFHLLNSQVFSFSSFFHHSRIFPDSFLLPDPNQNKPEDQSNRTLLLLILIPCLVVALLIIGVVVFFVFRNRKVNDSNPKHNEKDFETFDGVVYFDDM